MYNNQIIEDYWCSIEWDVQKLWALELKSEPFPIDLLDWHLDIPLWSLNGIGYNLTPRQVMKHPEQYASEYNRMQEADLVYPIEVIFYKEKWVILDGVHRLLKAYIRKDKLILVRKVPIQSIKLLS